MHLNDIVFCIAFLTLGFFIGLAVSQVRVDKAKRETNEVRNDKLNADRKILELEKEISLNKK